MPPHRPRVADRSAGVVFLPYGQWVGIRSRRALVDATELHRTARQRKRNRQCSLTETAVTELHRALSRGFISWLDN